MTSLSLILKRTRSARLPTSILPLSSQPNILAWFEEAICIASSREHPTYFTIFPIPFLIENEAPASTSWSGNLSFPSGVSSTIFPFQSYSPGGSPANFVMSEINKRVSVGERVLVTTLTKRMAEDLSDYLDEHGIKARYLHSDIDTVERIEIIRDLRIGKFDVLVGINLLREGLDMPEVALVAILDADKEGFLRSDRSLIQTIGRAARHINGRAILYGDRITGSMQRAIEETDRRREKQTAHNLENNIVPTQMFKAITDVMDVGDGKENSGVKLRRVGESTKQYGSLSPPEIVNKISELEKQMFQLAKSLEFEKAAGMRDEIESLRALMVKNS